MRPPIRKTVLFLLIFCLHQFSPLARAGGLNMPFINEIGRRKATSNTTFLYPDQIETANVRHEIANVVLAMASAGHVPCREALVDFNRRARSYLIETRGLLLVSDRGQIQRRVELAAFFRDATKRGKKTPFARVLRSLLLERGKELLTEETNNLISFFTRRTTFLPISLNTFLDGGRKMKLIALLSDDELERFRLGGSYFDQNERDILWQNEFTNRTLANQLIIQAFAESRPMLLDLLLTEIYIEFPHRFEMALAEVGNQQIEDLRFVNAVLVKLATQLGVAATNLKRRVIEGVRLEGQEMLPDLSNDHAPTRDSGF
jgi:hypothetical protein